MRKLLLIPILLVSITLKAQQKNTLLDQAFWKTTPDVGSVKAEIAKGNSPTQFNPATFDATVLAINNDAPNATVKYLIEQPGNSVKKLTHDGRIYLHWAASRGNLELVQYLLDKGSDMNLEDTHGSTPVVFASNAGQANTAIYDAFIKAGLDIKKKYADGASLLLLAIANDKDLKLTDYFISKGLSLKDVDANGNTAFNYAAKSATVGQLKTLVLKGVKYNDNALLFAAQGSRRGANTLDVFQYLVDELKLKPTVTDKNGENVVHALARRPNQTETIKYFLAKGVDVNKVNTEGNTAFMYAAAGKDVALVELLLPKVKNINTVNTKGESALNLAVKTSSPEVVSLLLKNEADVNIKDKDGNNVAYYLVQAYNPQASRGPGGPTASIAGGTGNAQLDDFGGKMKVLQEKGLNLASPQKDGSTLYHVAVTKNNVGLLKRLEPLNIDVNVKNKEGVTALHKAAMLSKDDAVLKYLLSVGAKKELTTGFDETAYSLAKENELLTKNNVSLDFLK